MTLEVHGAAAWRARFRGRISLCLVTAVAALLTFAVAHAQTVTPEDEYKKLIKVSEDIQPLGETPFGERIGLYDGSLSFNQTDISIPGTGPTITIGRTFALRSIDERVYQQNRAFGDWDLDLPEITTVTANKATKLVGWRVGNANQKALCTQFTAPPSVPANPSDSRTADWEPDTWWQGYQMRIPGQGEQELLYRSASVGTPGLPGISAYPAVTKQNWAIGCLAQTLNDPTLEAFVAVAPDGTKYSFNYLVYRYMPSLTRPLGSSPVGFAARTDAVLSPQAASQDILPRLEGRMLATHIQDRFGNYVDYSYDTSGAVGDENKDRLLSISASDGRQVIFTYQPNSPRISSITVQGGAVGMRTWTYNYASPTTDVLTYQLSTVTQPDGSAWSYNLSSFDRNAFVDMRGSSGSCDAIGTPSNISSSFTATMVHPSGLSGSFTVQPVKRGRSYVPRNCLYIPNVPTVPTDPGTYASIPNASYSMAITQRQLSGAGIGTQTWSYGYSPSNESWAQNCGAGCAASVWTKVIYPDGHAERSTFSNRYDYTESLLISEEVFDGDADVSARRKLTQYGYVNPDASKDARSAAYPHPWGNALSFRINQAQRNEQVPMAYQVTHLEAEGSDQYTWNALSFDGFARATEIQRYNNFGYGVQERSSFQDDYAHWVLGLPLQSDNVTTGETVSRNVYDPTSLTLSERYRFGRKVMGYSFNGQGLLATFTDGNGKTTSLSNYKRGIPQSIGYPDGRSQSIAVDDLGQIASITNQAGAATSYGYDGIGRLARIDYPAGDSVAWAPKTFQYVYVGAERGVNGPHWVRVVYQGNKFQRNDYDAMLRPVMSGSARTSDLGFYVSARTNYDWRGRKTFESYPVDGAVDLPNIVAGVATSYDVLGRPTSTLQTSELGNLATSTTYLSGASKRVTDSKGNQTTSWFQVFDQPGYDNVVKVQAPEGVLQTIARDVYGNPQSITQGSITKTMTYDSEHRLCRTWEPESGSEIMAYDNADNLAWSVSGASFNGAGCGQDQVADTAKTVRSYDAMNRVTSVVYPTGTQPSTFTYDALGNPATATSGTVSWTFGRNKLGLLTAEVLAVDGWSWALGYGYDANAALSTVLYPDGEIVPYNPDALGRPTTVGGYAAGLAYFPDGDVKSYSLGNGGTYLAQKNGRNLLSNFTYGKGGVPNLSEDLGYDANGNVSQISDIAGNNQRTKVMSYDGLNRLLSATATNLWGTESYTYDTLNNIRTLTNSSGTNAYNYDGSNLLASISNGATSLHTFLYDARGNTVVKDGQVLNFDQANRLTSIPGKGDYTYDAAGRRVKKVTPAGTTFYAYNSAGQLMWEYDATTTNGTDYVYLGKKLVSNGKGPTSKIVGNVDGIVMSGDDAFLNGWACSTGLQPSIQVHLYAGGPYGTGTFVGGFSANLISEAGIQTPCHAAGTAYRFSIPLTDANRIQFVGQGLYVHGISPVGGDNLVIAGSGSFTMPPSIQAPSSPAPVHATASADQSTITVSWTASTNVTSYTLERSYNNQAWMQLWSGTATTVPLSGAVDGTYVIRVKACNAIACSITVLSNAVVIAHIPAAPASISVPPTSSGGVPISWPATAFATSYQVEHMYDGNWSQIYNGAATAIAINEGMTANWYYRVRACNANGCGGYATGGYVTVTLPPTATPPISGGGTSNSGSYSIGWSGVPGAAYFNLFESANGGGWTLVAQTSNGSWPFGGKTNGTYAYAVQACNAGGCGPWSGQVAVTVALLPPVPSAYISVVYTGGNKFASYTMYWSAAQYATYYQILRYPGGVIIYNTNGSSFWLEKDSLPYDAQYTYAIRACNAVGCSALTRQM